MSDLPPVVRWPAEKRNPCTEVGKPCTLCCKMEAVLELDKPRYKWCKHACAAGCGIYETRPQSCQDYFCVWAQMVQMGRPLPIELKPSNCGAIISSTKDGEIILVKLNDNIHWHNNSAIGQFIRNISSKQAMYVSHRSTLSIVEHGKTIAEIDDPTYTQGSLHHVEALLSHLGQPNDPQRIQEPAGFESSRDSPTNNATTSVDAAPTQRATTDTDADTGTR